MKSSRSSEAKSQPAQDLERDLQVSLHDNSKTIFVNSKRETLARYLTQLQVFSFTAADLDVVRGMPEARRRFLDRGITSLRPAYLKTISDYAKVLKQKNRVLQLANENELGPDKVEDLLAPWNEQLVRLGVLIHQAREEYVAGLNAALERQLFEQTRRYDALCFVTREQGRHERLRVASAFAESRFAWLLKWLPDMR